MKGEGLGNYPRTCTVCGRPVRITGTQPLRFEWSPTTGKRSWHTACLDKPPAHLHNPHRQHHKEVDVTETVETPEPDPTPDPQPDDDNGDE